MKKKKNFFNRKIVYLGFFIIFSFLPICKAQAADFLQVVSSTGPTSNVATTSQTLDFSVTFKAPQLTATPDATDTNYDVYFQPYCGTNSASGATYIVSSMPKVKAQNTTFTRSWTLPNGGGCPLGTKTFRWELYEVNNVGGRIYPYVDKSFTYGIDTNYQGSYYIYKVQSGDYYVFSVSERFADNQSCITGSNDYLTQNPTASIYKECQSYDSIPATNTPEYQTISAIKTTAPTDVYTLLAPIGELKTAPANIGDYFNTIFLIAIGLCGALAVIMIVIGGVQYMGDESIFAKTEAKSQIKNAILGLLIALAAYVLLNTINPDLLGKSGVNIKQVSAEINAIEYISSESFTQITGKKTLTPTEYDTMGRKVAKEVGIPFCAMRVILERESKGNPGAIGFDENVTNPGIPSRVAFVNSGKKYNGTTFTPSTDKISDKSLVNQGKSDVKNAPGLGVDWRFSKGLGLTQITLFPSGYFTSGYKTNPPSISTKDTYPTLDGLTPKDLLDPEKNLRAGAKIWERSWIACNKDIYGSWIGYGGGPGTCSSTNEYLKKEATTRTEYYNGCPEADKAI